MNWQYQVIYIWDKLTSDITATINRFAADGWELASSSSHHVYLKRPRP